MTKCFKGDNLLVNFLCNARHCVVALQIVYNALAWYVKKLGLKLCATEEGKCS